MMDEIEEMSFEDAFAELEQIVGRLESDQLTLEDSLMLFERGQALVAACSRRLDEAELKIEQITPEGDSPFKVEG
jgi:exodeoxyribonuclease VII small subunit